MVSASPFRSSTGASPALGAESVPYCACFDRLQDLEPNDGWMEAHFRLAPAYREWLKGDMTAGFSEARRLEEATRAGDIPGRRRWLFLSLGYLYLYLTLGKLEAAQKIFQPLGWQATLSEVAFARGEKQAIAGRLKSPTFRAVVFLAHLGRKEAARELLSDPRISGSAWGPLLVEPWQRLAEGKLALLEGNSGEGIRLLTGALRHLHRQVDGQSDFADLDRPGSGFLNLNLRRTHATSPKIARRSARPVWQSCSVPLFRQGFGWAGPAEAASPLRRDRIEPKFGDY